MGEVSDIGWVLRRIAQKYLRGKGPVTLVYAKAYRYYKNAIRAERYLKRQTRQYKDELIRAHGIEQG